MGLSHRCSVQRGSGVAGASKGRAEGRREGGKEGRREGGKEGRRVTSTVVVAGGTMDWRGVVASGEV